MSRLPGPDAPAIIGARGAPASTASARNDRQIAAEPSPPRPNPAAIGQDGRRMWSGVVGRTDMAKAVTRFAMDEKLVKGAHWAVFGIGVLSLTFPIVATAASAF